MKVPFMNLRESIDAIYPEIMEKITSLIDNSQYIGGREVEAFEESFAGFCGTGYAVGCSNGTDAIRNTLIALGVERGETVLVPVNTFIATAEAVTGMGAEVGFIDVDERTATIDPAKLEAYCERNRNKRIKAVIPVHLYGQMANMPEICAVAERYGLFVIEDAAQAHGAALGGRKPGSYGDAATFSFYPGKNLGAFGDAGAIVTNDAELYKRCKMLVDHGRWKSKYEHFIEGFNNRLDTIQAGILSIKLRHLADWTNIRREKAAMYVKLLGNNGNITLPYVAPQAEHVWHLFVIQIENRDEIKQKLSEAGISCGIHYPIPLHLQPAYRYRQYKKGDFPVSERLSQRILSLPLWPEIKAEQIECVCDVLHSVYR
ncbi:MAG: DegT/DnrJ/EryC1/StrS family aminotransferase [Spirochaetales bacterium]|nr:DegT/DnrJ/EryC1/StrS family aminotransferase [Spirochaetales bacterium]